MAHAGARRDAAPGGLFPVDGEAAWIALGVRRSLEWLTPYQAARYVPAVLPSASFRKKR